MKVLDALNWRYAVGQFSQDKLTNIQVTELLRAVSLSASSYGLQPYKIIVVSSTDLRKQLLPFSYGQEKVLLSSHLIVLAADTNVGDVTVDKYIDTYSKISGRPGAELNDYSIHLKSALAAKTSEQKLVWAHQQAYIALGNLLTSAAMMKIDTCPMTGIDSAGYDRVLGLKEKSLTTSVICPIGIRHTNDKNASRAKVRLDYADIVQEM
jgi:nitroreductase